MGPRRNHRWIAVAIVTLAGCMAEGPAVPTAEVPPATPVATATSSAAGSVNPPPAETLEPTDLPLEEPTPTPDPCSYKPYAGPWNVPPLLPASAIRVTVRELNLREGPCTAARKISTLARDKVMIVTDWLAGPVKADGYAWYSVLFPVNLPDGHLPELPEQWFPDGTDTDGGWIAATDGSQAFAEQVPARCPDTVDLETITAMLPAEWLACFETPIVVEGTYGCGGCGGTGAPPSEPRWLADLFEFDAIRVRWGDEFEFRPVGLHFAPGGPAKPPEGSIIRARIHVDDPAAQTCSFGWSVEQPSLQVPKEIAVAWCRERFVVDGYDVIGTDRNYPG